MSTKSTIMQAQRRGGGSSNSGSRWSGWMKHTRRFLGIFLRSDTSCTDHNWRCLYQFPWLDVAKFSLHKWWICRQMLLHHVRGGSPSNWVVQLASIFTDRVIAIQSVRQSASQSVSQLVSQSVGQLVSEWVSEWVSETVSQSVSHSMRHSAIQSASQSVSH